VLRDNRQLRQLRQRPPVLLGRPGMPWCRAAGVINDAQCSPVSRHRASIKGSQLLTDARRAAPGCARGLTWLGEARLLLPSACLLPLRLPCSVVCVLIVVAPPPRSTANAWVSGGHAPHIQLITEERWPARQERSCPYFRKAGAQRVRRLPDLLSLSLAPGLAAAFTGLGGGRCVSTGPCRVPAASSSGASMARRAHRHSPGPAAQSGSQPRDQRIRVRVEIMGSIMIRPG
jgi:hypothetical protein